MVCRWRIWKGREFQCSAVTKNLTTIYAFQYKVISMTVDKSVIRSGCLYFEMKVPHRKMHIHILLSKDFSSVSTDQCKVIIMQNN